MDSATEIVATTLFLDYVLVDLAGCDVVLTGESDVEIALVVTEIEIDLSTIVKDEDFTVPDVSLVPIPLKVANAAACAE